MRLISPKVRTLILLFLGILLFGAFGYKLLSNCSFLDGLYMTVITITTVGYGEVVPMSPVTRVFTIVLILIGASFVLYVFGRITETVVEGGLRGIYGRINMEKKIAQLQKHYIVCGFGRIGKVICRELASNEKPLVVIENDPHELEALKEEEFLFVDGDAADDKVLLKAGVERARGLIAVVSTDAANVYIILSARGLNPDLFILARSSAEKNVETKLIRAGANKVISPYFIGATRMAQLLVRPTVIDFIDLTVHAGELGLRLEEMMVSQKSALCNKSLQDSGLRKEYDLIVVAIKRSEGKMLFNPTLHTTILGGDTLILLGDYQNIKKLEAIL
ncbi:MAG: potassium channel protein [Deltaproteobacteria bacterium]